LIEWQNRGLTGASELALTRGATFGVELLKVVEVVFEAVLSIVFGAFAASPKSIELLLSFARVSK
jgi:hypothetical protein